MFCDDFIKKFETQYPDTKWNEVQKSIFEMFKEVFEGATALEPPCGIAHSLQSRAMYAADLMLSWATQLVAVVPPQTQFYLTEKDDQDYVWPRCLKLLRHAISVLRSIGA